MQEAGHPGDAFTDVRGHIQQEICLCVTVYWPLSGQLCWTFSSPQSDQMQGGALLSVARCTQPCVRLTFSVTTWIGNQELQLREMYAIVGSVGQIVKQSAVDL